MFVKFYPASNYTHYPTYDWTPYPEGLTMIRLNQTLLEKNQKFIEICDPLKHSDFGDSINVCGVAMFESDELLEVSLPIIDKSDNCSDMDDWNPKEHICLVDPQPSKWRCRYDNGSPAFYVDGNDNPLCLQGIVRPLETHRCPKSIAVNVSLYRDWINQFIETGAESSSVICARFMSNLLAIICAAKILLL